MKNLFTAGFLVIILAAGIGADVLASESVSEADVQTFIRIFGIDLGDNLVSNKKFIRMKDLNDLEKIVGSKISSQESGNSESFLFIVQSNQQNPGPEIGIFKLPSQELARKYAIHLFLSIEDGRAHRINTINVTQGQIGDLCMSPKTPVSKQRKKSADSVRTFVVFARNNVAVYVDSKRSTGPKIDVSRIAQYIDDAIRFSD